MDGGKNKWHFTYPTIQHFGTPLQPFTKEPLSICLAAENDVFGGVGLV